MKPYFYSVFAMILSSLSLSIHSEEIKQACGPPDNIGASEILDNEAASNANELNRLMSEIENSRPIFSSLMPKISNRINDANRLLIQAPPEYVNTRYEMDYFAQAEKYIVNHIDNQARNTQVRWIDSQVVNAEQALSECRDYWSQKEKDGSGSGSFSGWDFEGNQYEGSSMPSMESGSESQNQGSGNRSDNTEHSVEQEMVDQRGESGEVKTEASDFYQPNNNNIPDPMKREMDAQGISIEDTMTHPMEGRSSGNRR